MEVMTMNKFYTIEVNGESKQYLLQVKIEAMENAEKNFANVDFKVVEAKQEEVSFWGGFCR
jgi:hypothetical protein